MFRFLIIVTIMMIFGDVYASELSDIVKKVSPAVVDVYVDQKAEVSGDPLFNQFFGMNEQHVAGSGVFIDPKGILVTSAHVVSKAARITIVVQDGRKFDAKIVTLENGSDLAILRLNDKSEDFVALELADSDKLEVGEQVLAIGNPFGIGQTVTSGIISAIARNNVSNAQYQSFIQTDAVINPGNSGGALINMDGRLVGINTAIFTRTGAYIGIGFAVPSNLIKTLISNAQVTKSGVRIVRPWIGISLQDLDDEIISVLGLDNKTHGVLVKDIFKRGPAHDSGILIGDIITSVGDTSVRNVGDFKYRIATSKIGEKLDISVLRHEKQLHFTVIPMSPIEVPLRRTIVVEAVGILNGVMFSNLSPAISTELGLADSEAGVVVSAITQSVGSFALQVGDILRDLNGVKISSTEQLMNILKKRAPYWQMHVQRGSNYINMRFNSSVHSVSYAE